MGKKMFWMVFVCLLVFVFVPGTYTSAAAGERRHMPKGSAVIAASDLAAQPVDPHYFVCSQDRQTGFPRIICGLFLWRDARNGEIEPGLATKWDVTKDGLTWTFHLRKGVKFHSGNELTAHDYEYSWKKVVAGRAAPPMPAYYKNQYENIWAEDDYTLKVKTHKPIAFVPTNHVPEGARMVPYVVDSKYIEKVGDEEFKKKPSTCGFYKFVDQKYGEYIKLEASDEWYHIPPHRPYTKHLTYLQVPEIGTRLAMLRTGKADVMIEVLGPAIPEAKAAPGIRTVSAKEIDVTEIIVSDYWFQDEPSPILDKRVRQAMCYAINKKAIAEKLYFGEAKPQMIPSVATWAFGADASIKGYPYNPEKAKALLKEAGYPNGFKYSLVARPQHMQLATAVAGFWENLGLDIDLREIEVGVYQKQATTKTLRGSWVTMVPTSGEVAFWYTIVYKKGAVWSWCPTKEVNELGDRAAAEFDLKKREKLSQQLCRLLNEELPGRLPVISRNGVYAIGSRVEQFVPGFYNWWMNPEWLKVKD